MLHADGFEKTVSRAIRDRILRAPLICVNCRPLIQTLLSVLPVTSIYLLYRDEKGLGRKTTILSRRNGGIRHDDHVVLGESVADEQYASC